MLSRQVRLFASSFRRGGHGQNHRLDQIFPLDLASEILLERRDAPASIRKTVPSEAGEDAAWRFLDAVWDVPVGLGLCDSELRFVRVNEALASFDGLAASAHYYEDVLHRLPREFAEGLRRASSGGAQDVEFALSG